LRLHDRVFSGLEGLLHLRVPVRRRVRASRQGRARQDSRHGRLQPVRALHRDLHVKCAGPRRGRKIRHGRRPGLYEAHGLH
jgi:hypothetical protein